MSSKISDFLKINKNITYYKSFDSGQIYLFIAKDSIWSVNEDDPNYIIPTPDMSFHNLMSTLEEIIGLKKLTASSVSLGIKRYNWEYGALYDSYDCYDENLLRKQFISSTHPFYVMTDEYNVYKCLFNNGSTYSINKPTGQSLLPITLADGYIWKFMFNVPEADRIDFLTSSYIPLKGNDELTPSSAQSLVSLAAVRGSIEVITITDGGSDYIQGSVTITAYDPLSLGSGFAATATVDEQTGAITAITVTTPGENYSSLTTISISGDGTDATAIIQHSPTGGHGYNASLELGAYYTLVSCTLDNNSFTFFPLDVPFRKVGLITDHMELNTTNQYSQDEYFGPRHPTYEDLTTRNSIPFSFMEPRVGTILYINHFSKLYRELNQKETIKFTVETI